MDFRNYTLSIISQSILLIVTGFVAAYFYFDQQNLLLSIILCSIAILQILFLLNTVNRISRTLTFFFESVQNDDTSLKFPTNIGNKNLDKLHKSLNRINELIRKIKVQNEYRERFYHTLLEHSASGLISIDANGQFEVISDKAKQFIGVRHTSNLTSLKNQNPKLYNIFNEIKAGENRTTRIQYKSEVYLLLIKATEIIYDNKKVKLISIDNIKQELDEQEMDSWQKLIRVLTHEIMNSVAPIASLSNTLINIYKKGEKVKNIEELNEKSVKHTVGGLEVIKEQSDGLINFVKNYRNLTKIPSPVFETVHVEEWKENFRILVSDKLSENKVALSINIERGIKDITIDKKLFMQVVINLVNNAVDCMSGCLKKELNISFEHGTSGKTILKIKDSGCGMSKEILDKIFIPFFTTKDNGSGIGLSLSRQIIRLHGGSLSAISEEGKGSTFIIGMP